jgi:hypothetical protein
VDLLKNNRKVQFQKILKEMVQPIPSATSSPNHILTENMLTQLQNLVRMRRDISLIMMNRKEDCKLYTASPQFTWVSVTQICRYNATKVIFLNSLGQKSSE